MPHVVYTGYIRFTPYDMHFSTLILGAGLAQLGLAQYSLKDEYSGDNFANMFNFDTVSLNYDLKIIDIVHWTLGRQQRRCIYWR